MTEISKTAFRSRWVPFCVLAIGAGVWAVFEGGFALQNRT
jgi:hypothetical protein